MRHRSHKGAGRGSSSWDRLGAAALLTLCAFVGAASSAAAQAQTEVPPDGDGPRQRHPEAAEAIDELWSPYCPGLMLEVCPSPGGAALRDSIQTRAEEGMSSEELVDWVLANHGEEYRALPERSGTALLAWLAPPIAVLFGLAVVVLVLRRMRARAPIVAFDELDDPTEEEEDRLREALRELDEEEEAPLF